MRNRKQMLEIRAWSIILALNLVVIISCAWDYTHREPIEEEVVEESETELIQWKDTEVTEEAIIEDVEVETVTEPIEEEVAFYNVPLSEEVQMHVFNECEKHNIAPSIVFGIMWQESRFQADVVSPHGSIGLMQIAPKWHEKSMERLGCNDLFNPYHNITVGIDYLAYLKEQSSDIVWVLTAYRWGEGRATYKMENGDKYAINVLEKASEFQLEVEQ